MSGKIIDVNFEKNIVYVVLEDQSVKEIPFDNFDFKPIKGNSINIYKKDDGTYIVENTNIQSVEISNNVQEKQFLYNGGYKIGKVKFLLITFFLGGLGIHKFITARTKQGIIYLLFCWTYIPGLFALVEFVIAAMKNKDEDGRISISGFWG